MSLSLGQCTKNGYSSVTAACAANRPPHGIQLFFFFFYPNDPQDTFLSKQVHSVTALQRIIGTAPLDLCVQGIYRLIELLVRAAFHSGQLNVGHKKLER